MLKELDQAPSFTLKNQNDEEINLENYRGKKVVLYFYPKDDTPGCTAQACSFRDYNDLLKEMNVATLGVSFDDLDSHDAFYKKYNLNFDILSDVDKSVAKAYGVTKEKNLLGKKLLGISRSTFIIDEDGLIEKAMYKVDAKDNPKEIYEYFKNS